MAPCWHESQTFLLFANEEDKLRVYESSLGNYAQTRAIPRHIPGFNLESLTAISISPTQVLVCAGRRSMRRGKRQSADVLVYNTQIRFAEEAGKMPGGIRSVQSHAVYGGKLYLLMKEGKMLIICDLETGMARNIWLKDWSAIKGLLWMHKRRFSGLPGGILKAITAQYLLGRDLLPSP